LAYTGVIAFFEIRGYRLALKELFLAAGFTVKKLQIPLNPLFPKGDFNTPL
jgi:hypothetical protein